jgi:hypothetical protein
VDESENPVTKAAGNNEKSKGSTSV